MDMDTKVYSMREAAEELGISRAQIYYLKNTRQLQAKRIGAQFVITQEEIDRYKNNHREGAGNAR